MPDFDAITVALAARFASGVVTPPTGYDNIKISTGDLPGQMLPLPCVLTFPVSGSFTHFPGKRDSRHEFIVRLYYNQTGDLERDVTALRRWLTVLVDQLKLSVQLAGIVTSAHVTGYNMGVLTYAGITYSGLEMNVSIVTNEAWAAVA